MWIFFFFLMLVKQMKSANCIFSHIFSTQVSPGVQISWKYSRKSMIFLRALPEVPFLAVSHSSRQHHSPWALWGYPHSRALCSCWKSCHKHGPRVTPTFADFRSLNFLSSKHNFSQKAHYISELFSHTRVSLNHLYLKGKEKKSKSGSL